MINYQLNLVTLSGFILIILGISVFISGIRESRKLLRGIIFGFAYVYAGYVLALQSWRFDIIMQIPVLILTATSIYWVISEYQAET